MTEPASSEVPSLGRYLAGMSRSRIVLAVALIALGGVCVALPVQVSEFSGQAALSSQASVLIDRSLEESQNTFIVISGIKAGIALLEGSTVGVGVQVEVGDLIQPAYDYIDFFWKIFLYALVLLASYKILVETGMLELGLILFGIGALLFALGLLTPARERTTASVGRRCMLLGLLIAYVMPTALLTTEWLSDRYTDEMKAMHYESIIEFEGSLDRAQEEFLQLRERISLFAPGQSLDGIREGFVRVAGSVADSFRLSLLSFLYYSLLIVFDLLFFPFVSAWMMYKVTQVALDRTLQTGSRAAAPAAEPVSG